MAEHDPVPPADGETPASRLPRVVSVSDVAVEARELLFSMHNWVERADLKASILIAAIAGALIAVLNEINDSMGWIDRNPSPRIVVEALFLASAASLLVAGFMAGASLYPHLGPRAEGEDGGLSLGDLVYFGRLRSLPPEEIASALRESVDRETLTDHFANQIAMNAGIAWRKHRWLQRSMVAAGVASVMALAGLTAWVVMRHVGAG